MSNIIDTGKKIASDPIGYLANKVTGGPGDAIGAIQAYQPTGFATGGLSGSVSDGTFSLTRSDALNQSLTGLQSALTSRAQQFAGLRKGIDTNVSSIIGNLRQAGEEAIQGRARRAIGDLRENLARRRVAGSSFATDALSRAEAEFGKQEAAFQADVGLKEFEMQRQVIQDKAKLLDQETQANIGSFQAGLEQMNLEAGIASQFAAGLSQISAANAQAIADVYTQHAAARANIVGSIAGGVTTGLIA